MADLAVERDAQSGRPSAGEGDVKCEHCLANCCRGLSGHSCRARGRGELDEIKKEIKFLLLIQVNISIGHMT